MPTETKYTVQPPSRDNHRDLIAPTTRLLRFTLGLGWLAMKGLVKFAFKIPGMFARAERRNNQKTYLLIVLLLSLTFQSCSAIAGIFKAGVWVGVLAVVIVIAIIIFIVGKMSGGGK